jgi:Response regulators consisting of a CheY-like receiver domain and a winged-helix DNA-binding domain
MEEKILIIDDDEEIRNVISIYMKNEGYRPLPARDALEAMELLKSNNIDLVILDIMMPKMDGIHACMKIREANNMPVIIISAKDADADIIYGLASGADDYITKPFNPLELVARVKSQLRRYKNLNPKFTNKVDVIEIGDLVIDTMRHTVEIGGKDVKLTSKEFDILELLARNQKMVFSMERIYESVWSEPFYKSDSTVMVHIMNIREKIEPNPRKPIYIKTVWGMGYKI